MNDSDDLAYQYQVLSNQMIFQKKFLKRYPRLSSILHVSSNREIMNDIYDLIDQFDFIISFKAINPSPPLENRE